MRNGCKKNPIYENKLLRPRLPHSRLELRRYDKTPSPFADVLFLEQFFDPCR
jgi:hypothetical protein